jgi:hypothetical protein
MPNTYKISTTTQHCLRADMSAATEANVYGMLAEAAAFIGVDGEAQLLEDGRIVLGPVCATPAPRAKAEPQN